MQTPTWKIKLPKSNSLSKYVLKFTILKHKSRNWKTSKNMQIFYRSWYTILIVYQNGCLPTFWQFFLPIMSLLWSCETQQKRSNICFSQILELNANKKEVNTQKKISSRRSIKTNNKQAFPNKTERYLESPLESISHVEGLCQSVFEKKNLRFQSKFQLIHFFGNHFFLWICRVFRFKST